MSPPKPFYPTIVVLFVGGLLFLLTLAAAVRSCVRSSSRRGEADDPPPVEAPNPQPALSPPVVRPMPPWPAELAPRLANDFVQPPQVTPDAEPGGDPGLGADELKLLEFKRDVARRNKMKLLERRGIPADRESVP